MRTRVWGDGGNSLRRHYIADLSFEEDWILCVCDTRVRSTSALTLEDVWDVHRGKPDRVAERALAPHDPDAYASDAEVGVFLDRARHPDYVYAPLDVDDRVAP